MALKYVERVEKQLVKLFGDREVEKRGEKAVAVAVVEENDSSLSLSM